ncbi:MAG TPA: hypothetical protein VFT64_00240 [Rickettsiales bacterium]|nr:hypothetical protein [Rickettsiales bacterium]
MARRKKHNKALLKQLDGYPNLPTQERIVKGGVLIRNNIGIVDEPLRIDKLLRNGIIDEMQHLYGLQIITYWTIANRPFLRGPSYEPRIGKTHSSLEFINLSRMSAEDKLYKTMDALNARERNLISKICFEEIAAIDAGRSMGLPVNGITVYVRAAFDALGNALSSMRTFCREQEKKEVAQ